MKIVISKNKSKCDDQYKYIADRPERCGSASVGYGRTPKEALGDLIYNAYNDFDVELELPKSEYKFSSGNRFS
jgi:hypothetical protein